MPSDRKPARSRSRFAQLYADGALIVMPAGHDFITARKEFLASSDDDDVELLEVEITVIRSHGRPKLQAVTEHSARCPTCGDTVFVEVPDHTP